jgi:hypothetical protein
LTRAQGRLRAIADVEFGEDAGDVVLDGAFGEVQTIGDFLVRGAWFKTTITSDRTQTKKVDIGWTRELWLFVNGKLVYAHKNLFESEGARKAPDGRCSLENGAFTLPLEAGDNEVAVAIANNFFGWGLMLRLSDPEGVHLAAQ